MPNSIREKEGIQPRSLHDLCTTFPSTPDHEIHRDHHLEIFESVFSGSVDLLVLEGQEGSGKTTLLSQFAKRYPRQVVSSFVTPVRRHGYDPAALRRDYSAQLLSIVDPRKPFARQDGRDGVLQSLVQRLKRSHGTHTYYFVLDGLTDIADPVMRREVARLLPIGYGFRVIVSGEFRLLPPELRDNYRIKTTQAVNFSLSDVQQYLSVLDVSDAEIRKIYQDCGRGVPARLASVRRILIAGLNVHHARGQDIHGLFEQEWQHVIGDHLAARILGILAHSRHRLTSHTLSDVLSLDHDTVRTRIATIPFLRLDPRTSYVSFVSQSFADFASSKMSDTKDVAIAMIVEHLTGRDANESSDDVDSVPGYLEESGKLEEVISFLSPDYFSSVVERSESLAPLRRQVQVGMNAALKLRQDGALVRFGMDSSAIMEIETAQVSRSEIEALVATNQVAQALSLAGNCPLREDRIHLLGVIARCQKERDIPVDEDIIEQIRRLYGQIDGKSLGDKAIDIAADLFPSCPDVSVGLIEQGSWSEGGENELDVAYIRLSIATAMRQSTVSGAEDDLETIRNRIRNPRLRGFASGLAGRVQPASEVIAEVERIEAASDKLYVLRKWAIEHAARKDAVHVARYGLRTVVKSTRYAPNARVLRELSMPLLHTKDSSTARSLVRSFDGQRATVGELGPTEETVRLELNLAVAESLYDADLTSNRLVEVYLGVDELEDLSTKASCLARLLWAIETIDVQFEEKEQLTALCTDELDRAIADLLRDTAEQTDVTRRIISAMASWDVRRSFVLARMLNTAYRREEGLLVAIESTLDAEVECVDLKCLREAYDLLRERQSRDVAAALIVEYLSRKGSDGQRAIVDAGFNAFREVFYSVYDPMERCRVLCLLYVLAEKGLLSASDTVRSDLSIGIKDSLSELEPGWGRIDAGFRVGRAIADWRPKAAKQYLCDAEAERRRNALSSLTSEWTYQTCLRLAIRAFAGQLGQGYDAQDDMSRLEHLIERIPGTSLRSQLWAELAMRLFLREHSDDGRRVMGEHVVPLIETRREGPARVHSIISVAPALYRNHKTTALRLFDSLEGYEKDAALIACAEFIMKKCIPSDPYETHEAGYQIAYEDAVDVAELASNISQDNLVYSLIVALGDTLAPSSRFPDGLTEQQKSDVAQMIEDLVACKFPDQENIRHDGYVVASNAQLLRINKGKRQSWIQVVDRARTIPNRSDRAFVLAIIGQVLPAREARRREDVFREAISVAETIPCTYDRLARLNHLAGKMALKCPELARKCLTNAIAGVRNAGDGADSGVVRDVIDTAFKIDPDFAGSLVSLTDDDPARSVTRHEMKRRLDTLRGKKAIIDEVESWEEFDRGNREMPRSAWLALGSLNARRAKAVGMEQLRPALRAAGQYPLRDGYPILAWVIENAVRWFSGTPQSRSAIRILFEGAMHATELAESAGNSASVAVREGASMASTRRSEESLVVQPGDKEGAVEFVRKWFERSASEYVHICDQYFSPDELDLLMLVQSVNASLEVVVLTSRHCQQQNGIASLRDAYQGGWKHISDQKPPRAEIVVVGVEGSEKSPIHDRIILSKQGGISLGTSWKSVGAKQDSILRVLSEREAAELSERVQLFIVQRRREYGGGRLSYETVTL